MVAHLDHSEHSVQVIITEQGIADLRGKDPIQRAREIVEKCAHPEYRDQLLAYFDGVKDGHTPQTLQTVFAMHQAFMEKGDMRNVEMTLKQ
jgi:acetyl-CoA hydrolase